MSRPSPVLPFMVLAFLLGATILAVQPAGALPVSPEHQKTAESLFGTGAPFGLWEPRLTTNTFYIHSGATGDGTTKFTPGPDLANPFFDTTAPDPEATQSAPADIPRSQSPTSANGHQAAIGDGVGGPARFYAPVDLQAVDEFQVFTVSTSIWAACTTGNLLSASASGVGSAAVAGVQARLIIEKPTGPGQWAERDVAAEFSLNRGAGTGNVPGAASQWSGSATVGDVTQQNAPKVLAGDRLVMEYQAHSPEDTSEPACIMYYDGFFIDGNNNPRYSLFRITTDAMRVAQFTTRFSNNPAVAGEHATAFASADSTDFSNRRFVVEALQSHSMGGGMATQMMDKHANVRLYDVTNQKYVYYVDDTNGGFPREYTTEEFKLASLRTTTAVPEPDIETHLGTGLVRRSFVFGYDETQPDIKIRPEFYSFSDGWTHTGAIFALGGKGIAFQKPSFETGQHSINPREPTEFAFLVRNTGTTDDSVSVSVADPGDGWTARVLGGGIFALRPGGAALGTVELTPPAAAVAGATKTIQVTASSIFPEVDDPDPIAFTATVTNTVTRGVSVSTTESVFQVSPGQTKSFPLTVVNTGSKRDSFTVIPSFPSTVQGWTVTAVPSSLQVPAGGLSQVQVRITPSQDAATGMTFPLGLTAVEVGNSAVNDRVDVTVDVFARTGVLASVLDPTVNRTLRVEGASCVGDPTGVCQVPDVGASFPDTDFDPTALFRVPVANLGDRTGSYKVEAFWDKEATGDLELDDWQCQYDVLSGNFFEDTHNDGVPDGWRFNYGLKAVGNGLPQADTNPSRGDYGDWDIENEQGADTSAFSGYYRLNTTADPLVVAPHATRDVYFELGYLVDDPCPVNDGDVPGSGALSDTYSPIAALTIIVTDLADPTVTSRATMIAERVDAGAFRGTNRYDGAQHLPAIGLAAGEKDTLPVATGQPAIFDLVAVNKGNEHDGLKITVAGAAGWTHAIVPRLTIPDELPCDLPASDGSVTCPALGVFDEVHFQVVATPGPLADVGDRSQITVTVTSTDAPGIARTLGLVARYSGTYDFDVLTRGATTRTVAPGSPLSFPFVVRNEGTADDSYRMSWVSGAPAWQPTLDTSAPVFVPAGSEIPSLFTVVAPSTSAAGATDTFRVRVESVGSGTVKTFEVTPVVQPASGLQVFAKDGQDVLIPTRATDTPVTIRVVQASGTPATQATLTVDSLSLPPRWTVDRATASVSLSPDSEGKPAGEAVFKVRAPADALGSSHGLLRVEAATVGASPLRSATDVRLNLASTFGVDLNATDGVNGTKMVIAPGGPAVFNLTVHNRGLGTDVIEFTHTQLPAGWTLLFNPGSPELGPLEKRIVEAKLTAPSTANPGDVAAFVVFAASKGSATEIDSLALQAQVGFNAIRIAQVGPDDPKGGPQDTLSWVLNVTNAGTLPDEVRLTSVVDTSAVRTLVNMTVEPARVNLAPNETAQVRVSAVLSETIPSDIALVTTVTGASLLDERATPATATAVLEGRVLPYAVLDVNQDSRRDFAVDRDGDLDNGFESFSPNARPGGRPLASANLTRFLTEEALASFSRDVTLANGTVVRVTQVTLDGDGDGKADHLLDADSDGQPDYYWDPDANKASRIEFRKDVNGDQVPESFIDASGDGSIDVVYDLTRGTFTKVIQLDVDGDGQLDYIVDKDGDGQVDPNETVLYTRTGSLLIVQKVDVDGDGRLDQVFDTDGDGNPDYFVPAGSTASVPIVLRDVNGDGTMDWTFDGDDDGRRESYYDPVTGEAHVIDATGHFLDALKRYWYIGALFALVLVLFVALVAVTRR